MVLLFFLYDPISGSCCYVVGPIRPILARLQHHQVLMFPTPYLSTGKLGLEARILKGQSHSQPTHWKPTNADTAMKSSIHTLTRADLSGRRGVRFTRNSWLSSIPTSPGPTQTKTLYDSANVFIRLLITAVCLVNLRTLRGRLFKFLLAMVIVRKFCRIFR